ncbi:unnamed protein product, partial [Timema podura]|nr:unnamed protein product [Timema podura]
MLQQVWMTHNASEYKRTTSSDGRINPSLTGSSTLGDECVMLGWSCRASGPFTDPSDGSSQIDSNSLGYSMASLLVFSKIKKALGLDRCKTFLNGAAPLSIEVKKYFLSLDILLCDAYGMSETTAGHTVSRDDIFRLTSAGKSLPGTKTKIYNPGQDQQGEVRGLGGDRISSRGSRNLFVQWQQCK